MSLCKKDIEWLWTQEHQATFEKLKDTLKNLPTLKYFDVNSPITLSVDSSKHSVGAVIMQDGRPVAYATKALDQTQQNYSQIEKEAFAIKFGCLRFHQYVWGCRKLVIETDHKPLVSIAKKPLHSAPPRLQRIMFDIMPYRPEIIYKKGTEMFIADTLSRDCTPSKDYDTPELQMEIHVVVPLTEAKKSELLEALQVDPELSILTNVVLEGWPEDVKDVPECIKKYWTFRDEFAVYEGILFRGDRIVIPDKLKEPTLKTIHLGHLGIQRSLNRARENVYWYRMNDDVTTYVKKCKICQRRQRDEPEEPLMLNPIPDRPWQICATDIFRLDGKDYLVIADSYSGYFDFSILRDLSSSTVIKAMKNWFATHGIPETLCCDAGTQLISREFYQFSEDYNFNVQVSSPEHKRSNGLAERYVQEAKALISKCVADGSDIYLALLNSRNTPRANLGSPVQRLMGRTTKGTLPTRSKLLEPRLVKNVPSNLGTLRQKSKAYRDRGSRPKQPMEVGQKVLFRQGHRKWSPAEVIPPASGPRSYIIRTPEGATYRRNSWFLRPDSTDQEAPQQPVDNIPTQPTPPQEEQQGTDIEPSLPIPPDPVPERPTSIVMDTTRTRSGRTVRKPQRLDL